MKYMDSDEKISGYQISLLFFTFIVSTIILPVPGITVAFAKQNAWLSILPASLTGIVNIYVLTTLSKRYPRESLIQYVSKICGSWIGKLIGFYYIYYLFVFISSAVNEHARFLNTSLLIKTPPLVLMITLLFICGLTVMSGVESIGRCNEVITLIIVIMLIPVLFFSLREGDPLRLTPVLGDGLVPVIKGAVVPSAWMGQFFFLGWFLPYLNENPQKVRKKLITSFGGIVILIMTIDLLTIMVFGPITPRMKFAFLHVIKYTSIGSLERLEAIAISIWILGIFIKVSMLLFMLCLSVSQLFGTKNYRKTIVPVTMLSAVGSVWIFKNDPEYHAWIMSTYPVLALFTQSLLPLMLLIIDTIKAKIAYLRR